MGAAGFLATHHQTCCASSFPSSCLHWHPLTSLGVYYESGAWASRKEALPAPASILWNVWNSISYAFSLLPQPMQLISHCDKCSLALNFSSESWLPKCVQKGRSKVMQSWPRWINLNFKSTLVKQFFNTAHLGFPPSRKKHHFKPSENPQFHVSSYVHNIIYFIPSHHRELVEIKCLFTFQHSSRAVLIPRQDVQDEDEQSFGTLGTLTSKHSNDFMNST